jgi:hypothetical protein
MIDDPGLSIGPAIKEGERNVWRALRKRDRALATKLETALERLDDRLAWAVPTSPAGVAFKLRKGAYFVELGDEESTEVAKRVLHRIANRVTRDQLRPVDLAYLRYIRDGLREECELAARYVETARVWLARLRLVCAELAREAPI